MSLIKIKYTEWESGEKRNEDNKCHYASQKISNW